MSRFRIRKGDREFTAAQLETLAELASRGLLLPDDLVSVDEGTFRPAREVEGLRDAMQAASPAEDAARHWEEADEDLDGQDDVLTSFLDQLTEPSAPPEEPELLTPDSIAQLSSPSISALDPEPAEPEAVEPPPAEPDPEPVTREPAPSLRLVEPDAGEEEGATLAFKDWLDQNEGEGREVLQNFGRYDDGIVVADRARRDLINPWRVLFLVFIGAVVIGGWSLTVTTVASTEYPTEAELEKRVAGGFRSTLKPEMPVTPGKQNTIEAEKAERFQADRALRRELDGQIIHFSNAEGLEDALFQDLFNRKINPISVEIEALELRGGTELHEAPVRANVVVKLGAPRDAEYGDAVFQKSLKTTWMMLGKYQAQGRLRFQDATVVMADPLPWDELYEGDKLLNLWNGQLAADALFLDNR